MIEKDSVIIVGAGPCGLAAAGELLRQGVPVRVLEAAATPRDGSRAVLLWPPALEVFRAAGVLAEADRRGVRATALNYQLPGGSRIRVRLDPADRPLLLPQAQSEALLEGALRALGGVVERPVRVIEVAADDEAVTVKAAGPNGTETFTAGWLVAADGVYSTVRDELGIDFAGAPLPDTILVAEGRIDGVLNQSELHYYLGRKGASLVLPLPGGRFRFGTPVAPETTATPELVELLLDERGPGGLSISDLSVLSTFTSQERIAARLRHGRCFLVGDAAHTHSAIGGQGLNLGLQDVRNLTWKLGGVIAGRLRPEILDTYDSERRYAAEETVRATHRLARVMLAGPVAGLARNAALRLLQRTGVLQRVFPAMLAGRRLRYPDGQLGVPGGPGGQPAGARRRRRRGLPTAGERTPQWAPPPSPESAPLLRLVTAGPAVDELARHGPALAGRFPQLVRHEHVAGSEARFLLARPDGYVAASGVATADLALAEHVVAGLAMTAASAQPNSSAGPSALPEKERA
jgi:2-polyprenyl-6-methoxyphenol hydroxylase-like FAD-dependent oxidoreductase